MQEKIKISKRTTYFEGKAQVIAQNGAFDAKLDPNETQATQEAFEAYLKEKGCFDGKQPGTILQVKRLK